MGNLANFQKSSELRSNQPKLITFYTNGFSFYFTFTACKFLLSETKQKLARVVQSLNETEQLFESGQNEKLRHHLRQSCYLVNIKLLRLIYIRRMRFKLVIPNLNDINPRK